MRNDIEKYDWEQILFKECESSDYIILRIICNSTKILLDSIYTKLDIQSFSVFSTIFE